MCRNEANKIFEYKLLSLFTKGSIYIYYYYFGSLSKNFIQIILFNIKNEPNYYPPWTWGFGYEICKNLFSSILEVI